MNKEVIKTGSFESIAGKILILGSRATANSLRRGMYYTSDESGNIIWDILGGNSNEQNNKKTEITKKRSFEL